MNKLSLVLLSLTVLLIGCLFTFREGRTGNNSMGIDVITDDLLIKKKTRKPFLKSDSFVCFYGTGNVAKMSQSDIAIVDARNLSLEDVTALKDSGTYVVSYVTVGEDDVLRKGDGKGPDGYASYLMDYDKDGKPDKNINWNSYYVNAGDKNWQDYIINTQVKNIMEKYGCEGVFLDTVDTVDIYKDTEDGMISLISNMRNKYPDMLIVQNRGFVVLDRTKDFIDGIMYEDFSINYDWGENSYDFADEAKLISTGIFAVNINNLRKEKDFIVLDLGYADLDQTNLIQFCYNRAWEYNFIPYVSTIMLDEVYPRYYPKSKRGIKAFTGENGKKWIDGDPARLVILAKKNKGKLDYSASRDKNNVALACNGAKVKADTSFSGYNPIHVIDGYTNDSRINWMYSTFASLELPVDHWIEIKIANPKKIKKIVIHWALDNGVYYPSREIRVEYNMQGHWKELAVIETTGENQKVTEVEIKVSEMGRTFRFFQPKGMGARKRPNLMWIGEIEIY